jgi:type I restriction enzyme S subunit
MKHNWEYKRLGDVCQVIGGSTPKSNISKYWNGDLNWFTPAEIDSRKYYSESERKITQQAVNDTSLSLLPKGTVLLTSRAPIGKVGILSTEAYCNQGFKNLICSENIYNEYLYYTLIYFKDVIMDKGHGATFKEISKSITESIAIPVPPMEVQKQIVEELDKINEVIADNREMLNKLNALQQSIFYEMFGDPISNPKGWETELWGNLFDNILGKMLDRNKQNPNDRQIPYLANQNVQWGKFIMKELNHMSFTEQEIEKYRLQDGDLLICEGGESGRCAIWKGSDQLVLFQKAIHRSRVKSNKILPLYVRYWLEYMKKGDGLKNYIIKATIEHLTGMKLKKIPVHIPPIFLQEEFASKIEAIETQKANIEETIRKMQTLLDSRMDYWFN